MSRDRGSGTVLTVGVLGAVAALLVAAMALVSAAHANTRARTAADLGALAAAGQLARFASAGQACAAGSGIVARHGGRLRDCRVRGLEVEIVVSVASTFPGLGPATARSRAGPRPA